VSAAITSGVVALLLDKYPDLTPDEVKGMLTDSAQLIPGFDADFEGSGAINLPALALERVVFGKFAVGCGIRQVARPAGGGYHDPGGIQRRGVGHPRRDRRALMEIKRIKRVPVVHDGKIVGIVSRADLLQVLASGGATTADEDSDRLIRERLLAELGKQEWANPTASNVVVSDGVVHFWGTVGSEEERTALRVVAENIPGVRGIEDHTISGPRYLTPLFPAA